MGGEEKGEGEGEGEQIIGGEMESERDVEKNRIE